MPASNPDSTQPTGKYFVGFDTIRFFAASGVVFCHIELVKYYRGLSTLVSSDSAYETGRLMIAAFLALSGFIITTLLLREKEKSGTLNVASFYMRRVLRIWPLYYLVVLLVFFVFPHFAAFYLPGQSEELQQHFWVKLIFSLLLMPQMLLAKFQPLPAGEQLWTIGTEEIFYLLWPLVVLKSRQLLRATVLGIVLVILVKVTLYHYAGYVIWPQHPGLLYRAYLVFYYNRIDCILLGAASAVLVYHKNPAYTSVVSNRRYAALVFLITIALLAFGWTVLHVDYFYYALCSALLLSFVAVSQNTVANWPIGFTERMGKASYGIYIWHYAMVLAGFTLLNHFFAPDKRDSFPANLFLYAAAYILTYAVALISYRFIETPFLNLRRYFKR